MTRRTIRIAVGLLLGICMIAWASCGADAGDATTRPPLPTPTSVSAVATETSSALPASTAGAVSSTELMRTSSTSPDSSSDAGPTTNADEDIDPGGKDAVLAFLNALADKDYAQAASLYGDVLIAPGRDRAGQLATAVRLLVVLPPRYVRTESHGWLQTVWVELMEPDGKAHIHAPPEGAPGQPTTEFAFDVVRVDGRWWVMSLPPYEE